MVAGERMRKAGGWATGILLAVSPIGLNAIPAWGEDGGARCCGNIEHLMMGLTTAPLRNDNSNLTLRAYGQLNRAAMFWDDGVKSKGYAVDNETSSSRLGMYGKYRFSDELKAGVRVEVDLKATSSSEVSSGDRWGMSHERWSDFADGALRLRHAYWYLDNSTLGRVTVGQQSPATDDITLINLGSEMSDAALHYNNSFALPIASPGVFHVKWGDLAHTVDSSRGLFVRYDTPTLAGFVVSVAGGEDQRWDAGIRYSVDWGSLRLAAGIGYAQDGELDFRDVRGSLSALHMPTGLFVSLAGGLRDDDGVALDVDRNGQFYFAQAGLSRRFLSVGKTTVYGEVGRYDDFSVGRVFTANLTGKDRHWAMTNTEVDRWGFGIEQAVESSKLLLYGQFHHYEASFAGQRCIELTGASCTPDLTAGSRRGFAPEPWKAVVVGARIQF